MAAKFSKPPKLIASNFWVGDSDPGAFGVRHGPRIREFLPYISPPGILGQGSHVAPFWNRDNESKQNVGSRILIFGPRPEKTGPGGGAGWG